MDCSLPGFPVHHHLPAAAAAKSLQLCPTLCDPIDSSPPGSPVPGILQARTLEWVAISFSSAWKKSESEVTQSCPTLRDPMDYSLSGSFVHGIFQVRVLEWVAIAFSTPSPGTCPNSCSFELEMPSNHLILFCPHLLLPLTFPSIWVFSNKSVLCIRWPKYSQLQHQSLQWIFSADFL